MDLEKKLVRVGILAIDDDNNDDGSGGRGLKELVETTDAIEHGTVVAYDRVTDDVAAIRGKMIEWCSQKKVDVLLSTGGIGLSARDVTPEATIGLIQKHTPGITNVILNESLKLTPMAMLSRGVSGIFEKTLIINLPGSEEAAKECLQKIACTIPHAISLIRDDKEVSKQLHDKLSSKIEYETKMPVFVTKSSHEELPLPKTSIKLALNILKEHSHIQYDENNKLKFPSVWIFSIGDKLVDYSNKCLGSVIETNTLMIEQLLEQDNYEGLVSNSDIAKENFDDLVKHFDEAFNTSDIIVTSGGVHKENDLVKHVLIKHFNGQIHFDGVNMKPGRSTTFVTLSFKGKKKYVFCLPGSPVSVGVCTHLFLLPYLRSVSGRRKIMHNFKAKLTHSIDELDVRPEYKRALIKYENGEFRVSILTSHQHSNNLLSFFESNCLLQLPSSKEKTNIEANSIMDVIPIKSIKNTYIAPILKEKNWNLVVLKRSNCLNAMNNARINPEFIQSSCLCVNEILDLMENMFILCTKCVYTTSAIGYTSEIEINSSENKLPNFPAYVNDGYPIRYIDTDPWSRRENILNVVEVSLSGIAPNYPKKMQQEECAGIITCSEAKCVSQVEDTSVDATTEMAISAVKVPEAFENTRLFSSDISERQCLVDERIELGPFEIAYLSSVGCISLVVYRYPTVRIIPYNKYSMCGTSNIIKNILEMDGFKEKVYTYPVCQQLNNISLQYEYINDVDDVIIICAEDDMLLPFEAIGDVEVHFNVKYQAISFGFGAVHLDENRLIFFHTTSCNPDYIYTCMHLFVLPFLRFTAGRKQRISTITAKCNTSYDLPLDKFEKSELRYEEDGFEVICHTSNKTNCLVKMPLLTEMYDLSKAKTNLDVIVTENSDSYFINY